MVKWEVDTTIHLTCDCCAKPAVYKESSAATNDGWHAFTYSPFQSSNISQIYHLCGTCFGTKFLKLVNGGK